MTAHECRFTWNQPGLDLIMRGSEYSFLGLPTVMLLLVFVFRLLEVHVRFDNKVRSANKSEGYQHLTLVAGMITCHHIPGPPAFLMYVEKLGVAWGRG